MELGLPGWYVSPAVDGAPEAVANIASLSERPGKPAPVLAPLWFWRAVQENPENQVFSIGPRSQVPGKSGGPSVRATRCSRPAYCFHAARVSEIFQKSPSPHAQICLRAADVEPRSASPRHSGSKAAHGVRFARSPAPGRTQHGAKRSAHPEQDALHMEGIARRPMDLRSRTVPDDIESSRNIRPDYIGKMVSNAVSFKGPNSGAQPIGARRRSHADAADRLNTGRLNDAGLFETEATVRQVSCRALRQGDGSGGPEMPGRR